MSEQESAKQLQEIISHVTQRWGAHRFTAGDCHILALALYQANHQCGSLLACLRKEVDEDGEVFSTIYSHMVYCTPGDTCWDIDGTEADVRWTEQFENVDEPDEDGLLSEFDWLEVPCALSDYSDLESWLHSHSARFDRKLLADILSEILPLAELSPQD